MFVKKAQQQQVQVNQPNVSVSIQQPSQIPVQQPVQAPVQQPIQPPTQTTNTQPLPSNAT